MYYKSFKPSAQVSSKLLPIKSLGVISFHSNQVSNNLLQNPFRQSAPVMILIKFDYDHLAGLKTCSCLKLWMDSWALNHGYTITSPGPEVIKLFSCSAQLRLKFILLINVKMPTIVGILTFIRIKYRLW